MVVKKASSSNPAVLELLRRHPRVESAQFGASAGIAFHRNYREREVLVADLATPYYGLIEIIDNNPLVCADRMSVPSPAVTLGLIALAPLALAGLIVDAPVVALNLEADPVELETALAAVGWDKGVTLHSEPLDLGGVLAASAMVSIQTPDEMDDLDALYEEQFGRSLFVRRDEASDWGPDLVRGMPHAVYRLRIVPDDPHSLLTVRVLSDREGKCGAAQLIHAFNVMCGFEESLGLS